MHLLLDWHIIITTTVIVLILIVLCFLWLVIKTISTEIFLVIRYIFGILFRFIFEQPCWVIIPVLIIGPFLMNVLIGHKLCNYLVTRIRVWLSISFWKILLPVRINNLIGKILEELDLACRPFIEVHRFDFSDMYTKLAMNTCKI